MLNWKETEKELPELGKVNDYFSSGIILGWDGEETCPYVPCMYENGTDPEKWEQWVSSYGDVWETMAVCPKYWAELNSPE